MTLTAAAFHQLSPGPSPALHDADGGFSEGSDGNLDGKKPRKLPAEKRAVHNKIERARRESLNGRFQELADALPTDASKKDKRASKSVIVNRALHFVCNAQIKEYALTKENNELRVEVNQLRAQLGMSPLPAPTPLPTASTATAASPTENSTPPSRQPLFTKSFLSTTSEEVDSPVAMGDASDDGAMQSPPASVTLDRKPSLSQTQTPKVYSVTPVVAAPITDPTNGMLPAPIPFAHFPPTPSYFPHYDSYGGNLQLQQQQLVQQQLEQQAHYQYGFAPSIISQQHAAMISAQLQQAQHQRIYADFLLAAAQSSSSLGSDASFSMYSHSPQSSPNSSVNLENSPRSFCSNEMSFMGAEAHLGEFSFAGMNGVMLSGEEEAFGYC